MRLSRKELQQGLKDIPIENILLGATTSKTKRLTAKQLKFAEEIANGATKAGAYRKAYNSTAKKSQHQSHEGIKLVKNPHIAQQIEAIRLANEARKYATPAALRQLVIDQLTKHALDEENPPAQRLKALQLLGSVTEVAAFTERREVIHSQDASAARASLLDNLKAALRSSNIRTEVVINQQVGEAGPVDDPESGHPTGGRPPENFDPPPGLMHSIPHSGSPSPHNEPSPHNAPSHEQNSAPTSELADSMSNTC